MTIPNVPVACLQLLADQLTSYHAVVEFTTSTKGTVSHQSGHLVFEWKLPGVLLVDIIDHPHFPYLLLKGGIKQLVEEVVEDYHRACTHSL